MTHVLFYCRKMIALKVFLDHHHSLSFFLKLAWRCQENPPHLPSIQLQKCRLYNQQPSYWVQKELRDGAEMYEQVLVQEKGYKLTLLQIDESGCDDEDD